MEAHVTREEIENAPLKAKIKAGKDIVKQTLEEVGPENTVIGFTGGKDSTLTAWLVKQVCEEEGFEKPRFMFVDHGQHFKEIEDYLERIADDWGFEIVTARNDDVIDQAEEPGDEVPVEQLNERNQREAERVDADAVPWLMDTEAGNHLLKTVPMNELIESEGIKAVINGVRWDEHESRGDENFFSPREDPDHTRIHPILQFDERDVWDAIWFHMVPDTVEGFSIDEYPEGENDLPEGFTKADLPISPKYWEGFRSLGSEVSTDKTEDDPAWLQDLENTTERAGRAQNKDDKEIMDKLRKLGYM